MRQMKKEDRELDALYIDWSEEQENSKGRPLKSWLQENAGFEEELLTWTANAPVLRVAEQRESYVLSEARVKEIGQSVMQARRAQLLGADSLPIRDLLQLAREKGLGTRALAKRVGIGVTFIAKMQDRLLIPASIPSLLLERTAEALGITVQSIRTYLEMPPQLASGAMFKASGVPTVGKQQRFEEALQNCLEMTTEEKKFWSEAQ